MPNSFFRFSGEPSGDQDEDNDICYSPIGSAVFELNDTHTFKYRNYYNPQRWYHSSPTSSMFSSQMFVLIWSNVSSIERYTANKIECDFSQSDHLLKNCWQTCLENCCKMSRNVLIPVGWDFAVKNHQRLCLQNVCNVCKVPGESLRDCSLNSWKTDVCILSVESL